MKNSREAERTYIAIDLKSFYASVECVERGLDPLDTNLVVADASRTEKTICLAVSPSLKAYGISGRARLFEVVQRMRDVNRERLASLGRRKNGRVNSGERPSFTGKSCSARELAADPSLEASYHVAVPRMAHYIEISTEVYEVYLRYIAPEDIHVYSIDEVLIDVTKYLTLYGKTARELAKEMMLAVLRETGITATAGIGSNLYLCKIAMDIGAKHTEPDADGVRIADLDEQSYRRLLWGHRPITDFWRVGQGTARKLARYGMFTMGDVARCSIQDEELLYRLFGVNAELLIDHAWGWEPCTMEQIKAYRPKSSSFTSGQVLPCPYDAAQTRIVVREMAEAVALDLVEKQMMTDQMVLTVGYDIENLTDPSRKSAYTGPVHTDRYGRKVPEHAHGTANLGGMTDSSGRITEAVLELYDRIIDPSLLIRRLYLTTNHVQEKIPPMPSADSVIHSADIIAAATPAERHADFFSGDPACAGAGSTQEKAGRGFPKKATAASVPAESSGGNMPSADTEGTGRWEQMDLFTDYEAREEEKEREQASLDRERRLQEAMLSIRKKYGKNAILKGTSLQKEATMRQRNQSIGGHKA